MGIRLATAGDLDQVIALLKKAGLPTADVTAEHLALIAEQNGRVQGAIGLEVFDKMALLRSLVVAREARGAGTGAALVAALEARCAAKAVADLWLLTIDADKYFRGQGYEVRERDEVPDAIRATEEFSSLCPGDAIVMSKRLSSD